MQDRPTVPELLSAVTRLLDQEVVPNLSGSRQFYGRVAANVLRIVMRELEHAEKYNETGEVALMSIGRREDRERYIAVT